MTCVSKDRKRKKVRDHECKKILSSSKSIFIYLSTCLSTYLLINIAGRYFRIVMTLADLSNFPFRLMVYANVLHCVCGVLQRLQCVAFVLCSSLYSVSEHRAFPFRCLPLCLCPFVSVSVPVPVHVSVSVSVPASAPASASVSLPVSVPVPVSMPVSVPVSVPVPVLVSVAVPVAVPVSVPVSEQLPIPVPNFVDVPVSVSVCF